MRPEILRFKVFEPVLLLGQDRFSMVDIRIRVKGGGYTSQIYGMALLHTRRAGIVHCVERERSPRVSVDVACGVLR